MKITAIDIERFGIWSQLPLVHLSEGLNVFYGPNEAGKTTLMQFVRGILYGFGHERKRYILPNKYTPANSPAGGSMSVQCPQGEFLIRRTCLPTDPADTGKIVHEMFVWDQQVKESLEITSPDGKKQSEHILRTIVSGVDEPTFGNIFAIGLDEIQKLTNLNDTEAGDMLFRLSIGLDRVSLVDELKKLTQQREEILCSRPVLGAPMTGTLLHLLAQRDKLVETMEQPKVQLREYCRLLTEQKQLDRAMQQLQSQLDLQQKEERLYDTAIRLVPVWDRRQTLRRKYDDMGRVLPVLDEAILQLEVIQEEVDKKKSQRETLREQLQTLDKQMKSLVIDEKLWQWTPRVEVVLEEEPRILELDQHITKLEQETSRIEASLAKEEQMIRDGKVNIAGGTDNSATPQNSVSQSSSLSSSPSYSSAAAGKSAAGNSSGNPAGNSNQPRFAVRGFKRLQKKLTTDMETVQTHGIENFRVYSRQVQRCRSRFARLQEQYQALKERTGILNNKMKTELAKREVSSLSEAIERTSEAVSHLRRGHGVTQRLVEMAQFRKELDRQNAALVTNQALPGWMYVTFGSLFVCGAVLITMWPYMNNPSFAVFGAPLLAAAIIAPLVMQKNNARKLLYNQRQLSLLNSQIDHARQELAAIDAKYPSGGKNIEQRSQEAQSELAALEKLLPVDAQRREAQHQFQAAGERNTEAKEALRLAVTHWHEWLKSAGLPAEWTPMQVRDLLEHYGEAGNLRRDLEYRYDSLNQRMRELHRLTERIDRLVAELGMTFGDGVSYVEILRTLKNRMAENDAARQHRRLLRSQKRQLFQQWETLRKSVSQSLRRRHEHLGSFGAKTAEELAELHLRYQEYLALQKEIESVQRELTAGMGGVCKEDTLAEFMEMELRKELPTLLETAKKEAGHTLQQLRQEAQSHGKLSVQLTALAADTSAAVTRRKLAILDENIRKNIRKWRIFAVTCQLLESIRKGYERERQPQTLSEASDILSRLTQGRYRRVWTPLGEDTLHIDDFNDNTLDLNWFSRGTREQLFVAIRLALTTTFTQHGSPMPLILDDVLVNYDTRRAVAAAKVLTEVAASGQQIFLFTCHEHICRIFQKLDVPVQILPSFADEKKQVRVLLPKSMLARPATEPQA